MSDKMREALRELVACKQLKDWLDRSGIHAIGRLDKAIEYDKRTPKAWAAALEALAEQPEQSAEPVKIGFRWRLPGGNWNCVYHRAPDSFELRETEIQLIYTAPPAPSVPDELDREAPPKHWNEDARAGYWWGWNACRAAMLAAAPKVRP